MTFETHITLDATGLDVDQEKYLVEFARVYKWKTSSITDDPILGPGDKFYLTRHDTTFITAFENMTIVWHRLVKENFKPIRKKIEAILFDERVEVR